MNKTMNKVTILIAPGVAPFQLENFSKDAERSVKGALHLSGNATKVITKDELETLKKARPELVATKIRILTSALAERSIASPPPKSDEDGQENSSVVEGQQPDESPEESISGARTGESGSKSRGGKKKKR